MTLFAILRTVECCWEESAETWRVLGSTKGRRRDKRGSPVEPQAIGMAWVLACRSVGARAAPGVLNNAIKDIFGAVGVFAPFGGRA
jgi:hypothetical protein